MYIKKTQQRIHLPLSVKRCVEHTRCVTGQLALTLGYNKGMNVDATPINTVAVVGSINNVDATFGAGRSTHPAPPQHEE